MGEQRSFPFAPFKQSQRAKHFQRREKVFGQFFTPANLAAWMVEVVATLLPNHNAALDPACGDGAFLLPLLRKGFSEVWGIDLDTDLLSECRQRCSDGRLILRHGNALKMLFELQGKFDAVVTNPPFSAKYGRVTDPLLLHSFELGRGRSSEALEVLFLELCVRALRDEGILAIILPEGIFANLPMRRVRTWICRHATPIAVISLSRNFFAAKSCVLIARKSPSTANAQVLLAHAETDDDLRTIAQDLLLGKGVRRPIFELLDNMAPLHHLNSLSHPCAFPLRPLEDFLKEMRCGSTLYGDQRKFAQSGIPFISAKTVTPFGIDLKRDGRFVEEGSPMDKPQARTFVGDVLFVRVGVGCIGRVAVVLRDDETGVADDYIYILRFKPDMLPEFFALYAQTHFFRQQLEKFKRGTGTATVPQKALRQILVPVVPLIVQQRFAQAYRNLHDRFRQGQIPDNELHNLVAQLERLLEGILSVHNAMSSLLSRPKQVGKNSLASSCIGANIRY
jgi:type I restriction enzyme M protein